ncbi:trypsin-like peptidase domain-containing protein [Leifsonia sp. YIM 134122]|uniref:Trypsin-like peptidase domain-containing protein n=1 Tax=Leifsonia stereocauli TaxID=3134136 RepID=A0ABU9W0A7_9MICO
MTESNTTPDGAAEQVASNDAPEQTSPEAKTPTGPTEVIEPTVEHSAPAVSEPTTPDAATTPIAPAAPAAPAAPIVTPPAAAAPAAPAPVAPTPVAAAPAAAQHSGAHPQATDAFGQPVAPAATVYAPGTAPQPYAQQTQPTQPYVGVPAASGAPGGNGGAAGGTTATKRRATLPIVAALIAGALIGGASGVGVAAVLTSNDDTTQSSTSAEPQNVVVNNTDSVNEITAVAAKASPSVVTISVQSDAGAGTGSGIVLSKDGYVLTNTHVVTLDGSASDTQIQVQMSDGTLYAAKLVGTDPVSDLAVIKLTDASGLTPLEFADSSKLNVGDSAVAIGAPLGLAGTVTNGIVSALNRSIQVASSAAPDDSTEDQQDPNDENGQGGDSPFNFWNLPDDGSGQQQTQTQATSTISLPVIQTDAAINPGNSGGALLNSKGELIGVNVAIASAGATTEGSQSGSIGVGFAVPSNLAERVANEIIKDGAASHGLLGASVQDATSAEAGVVGALIKEVSSGGAAEKAGLESGDIVTEFNGVPISNATDLTAQVRYLAGDSKADLSYVRDGKSETATVTLGEYTAG